MPSNFILTQNHVHRDPWLSVLCQERIIAVIRSPCFDFGLAMAEAVSKGGVRLIEITWSCDQPQNLIAELRVRMPHCIIGAGTILNMTQLREAITCGAQFIFSPHFDPELLAKAVKEKIPYVPGVLSPTEIVAAWQSGASALKVFPIKAMGGVDYLKSLKVPLSGIPLIPTGGVDLDNAAQMIGAGAIAVGLSGSLFPKEIIRNQNWIQVTKKTQQLKTNLRVSNFVS